MSHVPQRKEKDCLNCGTIVQGKYCHVCGQENIVPKETFWHMVTHFFYDITHFDSNFFTTVKDLLFKPGFLSKEYMRGRRASYLHPIKMYVFTSAIFFLLFFSVFLNIGSVDKPSLVLDPETRLEYVEIVKDSLKADPGNAELKNLLGLLQDTSRVALDDDIKPLEEKKEGKFTVNLGTTYKNFQEYDSVQKTLPSKERDGWLERRLMKIGIDVDQKFREDPANAGKKLLNSILHRLPYMLLLSLPFFALILKMVYIRRNQFYYADHGVFTIHLYVFSFLMLLFVFTLDKVNDLVKSDLIDWAMGLCFVVLNIYLFIAMRKFYGQSWWKTFVKYLLVAIFSLLMMMILFLLITIFSAATL